MKFLSFLLILVLFDLRAVACPLDRPCVALVLSGGGARGGAHIGVLREFDRAGVPVDMIVGTSYGALIGSLYAVGYSTEDIELIVGTIDWNRLLSDTSDRRLVNFFDKARNDRGLVDLQFRRFELRLPTGLQPGQKIRQLFDRLTSKQVLDAGGSFDRLRVPFRAVATDILTGEPYVFERGSLSTAVTASSAVPGVFAAVEAEGRLLVDGGIADNLPVDVALAAHADIVVAVDVSTPLITRKEEIQSLFDVLSQAIGFRMEERERENRRLANVVITPDLGAFGNGDFPRATTLIETGAAAARASLPEIQRLLESRLVPLNPARRSRVIDPAGFDVERFEFSLDPISVDEVKLLGLETYPADYVVEHVAQPASLTMDAIHGRVAALYSSGLFQAVSYRLERDADKATLTYDVKENAPTRLGLGLRYDDDYKFTAMLDVLARNFLNTRADFSLRTIGGNISTFETGLQRKLIGNSGLRGSGEFRFVSQHHRLFRGREEISDYRDRRYGGFFALGYSPANALRLEVAYGIDRVDIDSGFGSGQASSFNTLAGLRSRLAVDTLNNADFPERGTAADLGWDWNSGALGSDTAFTRVRGRMEQYVRVGEGKTVGLSVKAGVLRGTAPFFEQFRSGGTQPLTYSSDPFYGLSRDQMLSKHALTGALTYRHRLKNFQLGVLQDLYLAGTYNAGSFYSPFDSQPSRQVLHGFNLGLHALVRVAGPVRLDFSRTTRGAGNVSVSVGYRF